MARSSLGDAFAWLLLGLNRKAIHSLAYNERVPISQEHHGSRGILVIAPHLADQGWGFPLIHDVTDCLRIGDITFINPDKSPTDRFRTVEVKTKLTGQEAAPDGRVKYQYEVRVLVPASHREGATPLRDTELGATRADRQLLRMRNALTRRTAPEGELVELIDEPPLLVARVDSEAPSHWETLRRVIRRARQSGYASEVVEKAFLYAAFYHPNGFDTQALDNSSIAEDFGRLRHSHEDQS